MKDKLRKARRPYLIVFLALFITGLVGTIVPSSNASSDYSAEAVMNIPLQGTIDRGNLNFLERSLEEAQNMGVETVLLDLNTPGGYLDAAKDMRNAMDSYPGKIVAFVNPDALSAGAYIALAADRIYMVPGSTMGAAEPQVMGEGTADEKVVSSWEAEMEALAGRNDRQTDIASAMVRREVVLEDLVDSGELLTLDHSQAREVGYSEGTVESTQELLQELGLSDAELLDKDRELIDSFISLTTNPAFATFLLIIGFAGLVLEILTAGFGVAGTLSMLSFGLYFGGHILGGLAGYEVILLFVGGVVLMLIEAFMPGFGVFGIGGLIATFASIVMAAASAEAGITMLIIALVLTAIILFFTIRHLSRRGVLRRFILEDSESADKGYVASEGRKDLVDKKGTAITPLRPAGSVLIENERIDVVTEGEYIDKDSEVTVIRTEGSRVVVRATAQ